jgi:ankyrin repeat protein
MSRLLSIAFKGDLAKLKQEFARNPQSAHDKDVFCQAIGWNKVEIVEEFLANGANPNSKDRHGNHPLFMACWNGGVSLRVVDALLAAGSTHENVPELAFVAAQCSSVELVRRLIEVGVDFSRKNEQGFTPIAFAACRGREDVVDFLLKRRAAIAGLDTSQPIKPWKGSPQTKEVMERIRIKMAAGKTEPGASPNGGPAMRSGNSEASGGPPSVN